MIATTINTPIIIKPFTKHEEIKEQLAQEIAEATCDHLVENPGPWGRTHLDITRCDWKIARDFERKWVKTFIPALEQELKVIYTSLGYDYVGINQLWFQQYNTKSFHNWHTHTVCQWTGVYYLKLPKDGPKTEIVDVVTKRTLLLDVKEGDICCFPSFIIHRAPVNRCEETKLIVSWNISTDVHGFIYGPFRTKTQG